MTSGSGGAVEARLIFRGTGSGNGRRLHSIPHREGAVDKAAGKAKEGIDRTREKVDSLMEND